MLTQSDLERERYEARRKAQLDYNTGLKVARMEGIAEDQVEWIQFCERLLHRPETPTEQLASLSFEDLRRRAAELRAQLVQQLGRPGP